MDALVLRLRFPLPALLALVVLSGCFDGSETADRLPESPPIDFDAFDAWRVWRSAEWREAELAAIKYGVPTSDVSALLGWYDAEGRSNELMASGIVDGTIRLDSAKAGIDSAEARWRSGFDSVTASLGLSGQVAASILLDLRATQKVEEVP